MTGLSRFITHVRGVALTLPFVSYLLVADIALSLLLPLKVIAPRLVYDISSKIASSVWSSIQTIFVRLNGAVIESSGDSLPPGESAIVIANHVGWCDFYMIQALALRAGMLGRCRYFAKRQLRMVPFLGWGLWAMGMPMVSRNWLRDRSELDRVFRGIVQGGFPTWLVSFSEATRFSSAKYEQSLQWCLEKGHAQPQHLLYPRTKGFIATVQQLRAASQVKAVYDLTLCYQNGEDDFQQSPSMWETLSLPEISRRMGYKFHVHVRRFLMDSLPESSEDLALWLEKRWVEKGEWLEARRLQQQRLQQQISLSSGSKDSVD